MSDEEETPVRCPACGSLNTEPDAQSLADAAQRCCTCGLQWVTKAATAASPGPWRVGRKLGRTLYYNDQLVGMMDSSELASMMADSANVVTATMAKPEMTLLREAVEAAKRTKAATEQRIVRGEGFSFEITDVATLSRFVLGHFERVMKAAGLDEEEQSDAD